MKILLALIFVAGLATAFLIPASEQSRATVLWSDFLAFQTNVLSDPAGKRILDYGGENPDENFGALLEKLRNLNYSAPAEAIGFAIAALAAVGLILDFKRRKK